MPTLRLLSHLLDTERSAAGHPDAEALTDGRLRLTWSEYRERVARLAGMLGELGVQPGDRVGVHLHKSPDSFVAVHAILRVGGVMVPLDALAPPHHTASVIVDSGAELIVSGARSEPLAALVEATGLRAVVSLTADVEAPPGPSFCSAADVAAAEPGPLIEVDPDDLAYLMYTSGSTGRPKGIAHTHRSGLAYAALGAETYELRAADRLANIAPLHFDQSTFELYSAPLAGAAVLVVPDGVLRFPASLGKLIEQERTTVWYSVPYVLDQLSTRGALDERDLGSLRWVLYGGESFPPRALARLMERLPATRFSNVYGPAEVNQCTFFHLDAPPDDDDDPIPIGRPWSGAEVLVVDDDDVVVAPGAAGALLVRSETMMDRYWGRPDLTTAAFALRGEEGSEQRWYRTGDRVREREDGNLVFLGRVDNQVKVRGHRIELEAVEAVLSDQPGVEACAVVVMRPDDGDDHLVAVVAPAEPAEGDRSARILAALNDRFPRYAVPKEVVGVDVLPRTSSGKVDRGAVAAGLPTAVSGEPR